MKVFYLVASVVLTVLILILAFENINAQCSYLYFFFYEVEQNPTLVTLGLALIGIMTGFCYHAFLVRYLASGEEDEEGGENF